MLFKTQILLITVLTSGKKSGNKVQQTYGHGSAKHQKTPVHHIQINHDVIDEPICPEGYELEFNTCVKAESVKKIESCPKDSSFNGHVCEAIIEGMVDCNEGEYVGNLMCSSTDTTEGKDVCPKNSQKKGDNCYLGGLIDYCPVDSEEDINGDCKKIVPKLYNCPADYTDIGSLCLSVDFVDYIPICPDNTEYISGKCVASATEYPECPEGYMYEGTQCVKYESPVKNGCPPGYIFDASDFSCTLKIEVNPIPECADGGILIDGSCKKTAPAPYMPYCSFGTLVDNLCLSESTIPASYKCPEHYELNGSLCERTIDYDCSVTKVECGDEPVHTPVPHVNVNKHKFAHGHNSGHFSNGRKLKSKSTKKTFTPNFSYTINKKTHKTDYGYCEKETVVIPKTCHDLLTAEPIPFCTQGIFNGKDCVIVDTSHPINKCLGVEKEGDCLILESYSPVYICPDQFTPVGHGDICERLDIIAAAKQCPVGTTPFEDQCAIFTRLNCPNKDCLIVKTWLPETTCPIGYILTKTMYEDSSSYSCMNEIYVPKIGSCPEGSVPVSNTECSIPVHRVYVNDIENIPAQFICPVGYAIDNNICVAQKYIKAHVECPPAYINIYGTELCTKDILEVYICPYGSLDVNGKCLISVTTRPLMMPLDVLKVPIIKTVTKKDHHPKTNVKSFHHGSKKGFKKFF